ncbi:Gamma-glutamyltransferase 5 [Oryzias melastigma]|uniref:Glutathione hydrolase n=1 Tax=Oryzias melastigma TaxID=30732 RepID=A0A834BW22_ORYME|nr:Gamma-glutamyltransferase 5 [Oryzias melastigma]
MAKCKPWQKCCCIFLVLICAAALVCLCIATIVGAGCSGGFKHAAVAADSQRCSDIGKEMLLLGGSAVDGAIAALLCTSVVNPQSMGIGGGSILSIRSKTGNVTVYNFRETVPKSFKSDLLSDCPKEKKLTTGSQWIGVPGELRGYEAVHKKYGKLPWAKLFEPTIKLAREGIPMPPFLSSLLNHPFVKAHVENSPLCEVLCNKNKVVLGKGEILKFPKLAETMETIAQRGAEAFYNGSIGQDLILDIKNAGGTLSMEDLRSFKVQEQEAWTVLLGDIQMHVPPPPSGGPLLAFILKIMKDYFLTSNTSDPNGKIQMYHHYIEAVKFANGQKKIIRDPNFNDQKRAKHLIDPSFINRIRNMISPNYTHENTYYNNVEPAPDNFGTTHVSVLDQNGLAVSATSTINHLFGGAVYSPRTGIILNNELADFCNRVTTLQAGERPPSSMAPTILESKSGRVFVIGGSGGSMITSAMALSIINHLWLGMSLQDAIAAPIVFVDSENTVNFEKGFEKDVTDGLRTYGHKVGDWPLFFNVVNAVEKESGCISAVSDRRKLGKSAGY